MASKESKYGEGVDPRNVPFYKKIDDTYSPQIKEEDPINAGAWMVYEEKTTSQKDI